MESKSILCEEKMKHYYVVYNYNDKVQGNGVGAIEVSLEGDVFVPSEIREWLVESKELENVVVVSWRPLDENQLSPKD